MIDTFMLPTCTIVSLIITPKKYAAVQRVAYDCLFAIVNGVTISMYVYSIVTVDILNCLSFKSFVLLHALFFHQTCNSIESLIMLYKVRKFSFRFSNVRYKLESFVFNTVL